MEERGEKIEERFQKSEFFKEHELDALRDFCQIKFRAQTTKEDNNGMFTLSELQEFNEKVSSQTEYVRLTVIAQYTKWLVLKVCTIEFETTNESEACECCGGRTTALTRFVYCDGDAYAIYYARFSNNHPDRVVVATVSLGEWSESWTPEQHVAFAVELHAAKNAYQVGLIDAERSPWHEAKTIGHTLNRDEALAHPCVKEAFHVIDHMVADDLPIREYLNAQ